MNNLENKEILSDELLKAIDMIIEKCPDAVFGGSISLNAVGLLNRKISDIDLFFHYSKNLAMDFLNIDVLDIGSGVVLDEHGNEIQLTTSKINAVKCCIFKVAEESLQCSKFKFLGREINIQNVNHAITAKLQYQLKNPKHRDDLDFIDKGLDLF